MKLIFVYNANSGIVNALFDAGHKLFNASTYPCSLCALTYDTFTEKSAWKTFRNSTGTTMEFLHKDEFESNYQKSNITYPVILKKDANAITEIFNKEALDKFKTVDDLISAITTIL